MCSVNAHCLQEQRFSVHPGGVFVLQTDMRMEHIPYADCFKVQSFWKVRPLLTAARSGCMLLLAGGGGGVTAEGKAEVARDSWVVAAQCYHFRHMRQQQLCLLSDSCRSNSSSTSACVLRRTNCPMYLQNVALCACAG
jgi:hypothetical protein